MFQKILSYVNQNKMIELGDKIVAGVSGGADSVCLLFVLRKILETFGGELYVAHVNHGLRGEEALSDQEFVRALCEKWRLPFYLESVNLKEIAEAGKMTEEEAGRKVRYDFFRRIAEEVGGAKIAVGHNGNDNAETVLFHLIRGSSVRGLGGISPVQGNIIRPLLCVKREEIEQYLKENQLDFCMDRTNLEDTYTRNRIRHKLLPLMEEINPQAVEAICRAAKSCQESSAYMEKTAEELLRKYGIWNENRRALTIKKQAFEEENSPVTTELLILALKEISGSRKDIGAVHVDAVARLQKKETGKALSLPYGIFVENQYGALCFKKKEEPNPPDCLTEAHFSEKKGEIRLFNGDLVTYEVFKYEKNMKIPENRYTKWFDCDIIKNTLRFRTRQPGDWIQTLSGGRKKKLKDYLINEKIPRSERDSLLVLADGSEILWVVGYRMSEKAKITEHTKNILQIRYTGGKEDE